MGNVASSYHTFTIQSVVLSERLNVISFSSYQPATLPE